LTIVFLLAANLATALLLFDELLRGSCPVFKALSIRKDAVEEQRCLSQSDAMYLSDSNVVDAEGSASTSGSSGSFREYSSSAFRFDSLSCRARSSGGGLIVNERTEV
jgi:hypothetical protein